MRYSSCSPCPRQGPQRTYRPHLLCQLQANLGVLLWPRLSSTLLSYPVMNLLTTWLFARLCEKRMPWTIFGQEETERLSVGEKMSFRGEVEGMYMKWLVWSWQEASSWPSPPSLPISLLCRLVPPSPLSPPWICWPTTRLVYNSCPLCPAKVGVALALPLLRAFGLGCISFLSSTCLSLPLQSHFSWFCKLDFVTFLPTVDPR